MLFNEESSDFVRISEDKYPIFFFIQTLEMFSEFRIYDKSIPSCIKLSNYYSFCYHLKETKNGKPSYEN